MSIGDIWSKYEENIYFLNMREKQNIKLGEGIYLAKLFGKI